MHKIFCVLPFMSLLSCKTSNTASLTSEIYALGCRDQVLRFQWEEPIESLDRITELFRKQCYQETIDQIRIAKEKYGEKTVSVTAEAIELFIPEGTVTDYVLESYERGYLSFLAAVSYSKLQKAESVTVELNKFYNEETANIYNHGRDPTNTLLQAILWDNHQVEGFSSRPFWQYLSTSTDTTGPIQDFAKHRINEIDAGKTTSSWQIWEMGKFPEVDWGMSIVDSTNGYLTVKPRSSFETSCVQDRVLKISTRSWFQKLAVRHSYGYHPLVNAKSWIRLPFGLLYGITTIGAGAGIAMGGCALDAKLSAKGALCRVSIEGGFFTAMEAGSVVNYTLKPDLRHWRNLPNAFMIVDSDTTWPSGICNSSFSKAELKKIY